MTYVPKMGDIGLVTMRGWVGTAIRIGQWLNGDGFANYQHAFVHVGSMPAGDETETVPFVVEAMPGGALLTPVSYYDRQVRVHGEPVLWLRCPDEYRNAVAAAAKGFVGVGYSAADYFALALHRFRIPTPRLKRYIESSGRMICSQLADRAAELGGWHIFDDGRWHGDVTPGDLYRVAIRQAVERAERGEE